VKDAVYEFAVACDGKLDSVRWTGGKEDTSWQPGAKWTIPAAGKTNGPGCSQSSHLLGSPTDGDTLDSRPSAGKAR